MGFFSKDKLKKHRGCAGCTRCSSGTRELTIIGEPSDTVIVAESLDNSMRLSYLEKQLGALGIQDNEYVLISAACKADGLPKETEVQYCLQNVLNEIEKIKPLVVITLGPTVTKVFVEHYWKDKAGVTERWMNHAIPIKGELWLCPLDDPYYLYCRDYLPLDRRFSKGLIQAFELPEEVPYYKDVLESKIEILSDTDSMVEALVEYCSDDLVAFDYETTGLKPQAEDHDIYSVSFASDRRCTSFLLPKQEDVRKALRRFLVSDVKKVAQNLFFEDIWSKVILDVVVNNWCCDTMLMSHIQNNTKKASGLKFQGFAYLGIENYNSEIDKYLKGEGGNGFNRVHEAPVQPLLLYGGYDAVITLELYKRQRGVQDGSL